MSNNFMIMEPTNLSFQELLGNSTLYSVPRFQRDYAWEQEQWEDLWADVETLDEEQYHYMGYIVLQRKAQHSYDIIDGQQRLVTLTLLVLAILKHLQTLIDNDIEADDNKQRLEEYTRRYIGNKNPVSLRTESKLALNRNNSKIFKSICSDLSAPTRRGITRTNKLLQQCFNFFEPKIQLDSGSELAKKIEEVANGMIFTRIVVQDELNAYKVFETLNARGVQLSTPDLIKNYIFSIITKNQDVPDTDLDDLDERWSGIIEQLGEANFTDFIRYHHNVRSQFTTKKNLFKAVRSLLNDPRKAYDYLTSLTEYAAIYGALLNPYDEFWQQQDTTEYKEIYHYLEGFKLFNIKQPFSILMVAYFKMTAEEFIKLVRYLWVLSVRYNIIGKNSPNKQERLYNKIANKIYNETYKRASHVKNNEEYREMYAENDEFSHQFKFHKMPTRQSSKKVRFLLAEIETHLGNRVEYSQTTLEHICPYNPDDTWDSYFGEGVNDIQDRLGNVILLGKDDLKRKAFSEKKIAYQKSPFKLAQKISQYDDWNLQNLNDYQGWLAQQAVTTWEAK